MPPVARFKIAAIDDLLRQLEYAPAETRRRQMDAAEQLVADLDPKRNYPEDFIIYRITGYRPDRHDEPAVLVGEALLPDLINMVQVLSRSLKLPPQRDGSSAIPLDELSRRLRVSHKTVQRYRKQGLVCHYIAFDNNTTRLGCYEDALQRFINRHTERLDRAKSFTRISDDVEATIIKQARELRKQQRLSLNEAALTLAEQYGRAHETIRLLLRRHDRTASEPIFADRGPLTDRDIRVIHRAWRWGVEPAQLAKRFGKSKPTIHRAINRRRRDLLRERTIQFITLPTFDLPDAASVILGAPAVAGGLNECLPLEDAIALLEAARLARSPDEATEDALLAGYNFLKMRAWNGIANLADWPTSELLDAIETDLRWAGLLRRRLVMLALPEAIRRVERTLHRSLAEQPAEVIGSMTRLALEVVANAVEAIDPMRNQRLERFAGFAMERALAQLDLTSAVGRAAAKHQRGTIPLDEQFANLHAMIDFLDLPASLRRHIASLEPPAQQAVILRYGINGEPPLTCETIGTRLNMKPNGVVRLLQRAERALRAARRAANAQSSCA